MGGSCVSAPLINVMMQHMTLPLRKIGGWRVMAWVHEPGGGGS
jgi:hypothetical protein